MRARGRQFGVVAVAAGAPTWAGGVDVVKGVVVEKPRPYLRQQLLRKQFLQQRLLQHQHLCHSLIFLCHWLQRLCLLHQRKDPDPRRR